MLQEEMHQSSLGEQRLPRQRTRCCLGRKRNERSYRRQQQLENHKYYVNQQDTSRGAASCLICSTHPLTHSFIHSFIHLTYISGAPPGARPCARFLDVHAEVVSEAMELLF